MFNIFNMLFTADDFFSPPGTNFPISVKQMLRRTFLIYANNIVAILKVAVSTFIPAQIIIAIIGYVLKPHIKDIEDRYTYEGESDSTKMMYHLLTFFLYTLVLDFVGDLLYSVALVAITEIAKDAHAGRPVRTSYLEAMVTVKSSIITAIVAIFLTALLSNAAVVLLILPKIYLALSWWVIPSAIVVERTGVFEAMSRSWNLTSGYRCDLSKIYIAYRLAYYLCVFGINAVLIIFLIPSPVRYILGYCLPTLSFRPLGFVLQSVVYFDLRARKESLTRTKLVDEIETGFRDVSGLGGAIMELAEEEEGMVVARATTGNPAWAGAAQSEPLKEGGEGMWNGRDAVAEKYDHFEVS